MSRVSPPHALLLGLLLALGAIASGARGLETATLDDSERAMVGWIEGRATAMETQLADWVERNTGSFHGRGLEDFAARLGASLDELGFEVQVEPGPVLDAPGSEGRRTGPIVVGRRTSAGDAPLRLLLNGHYDTVFEPASPFQHWVREGERARGPGVADMKGGLVVLLTALRALEREGWLARADFDVLLNGDEEIGSLGSRPRIEELARSADVGLVFEAARDGGAMVRSRRGLGQFHLSVRGVAAHAGGAHDQGRSAVLELARKVVQIEALTDYARGVTLNVGTIEGGSKRNIVPDRADAWIDLRYDAPELGDEARRALEEIASAHTVPDTTSELWGRLHRPPKLATARVLGLLERHAAIAEALGLALPDPVHAGGGTDGSLMGSVGLPTLDSLGVVGGHAHTDREFVLLESLPERAAVAAILIKRLIESAALRSPQLSVD